VTIPARYACGDMQTVPDRYDCGDAQVVPGRYVCGDQQTPPVRNAQLYRWSSTAIFFSQDEVSFPWFGEQT